MSSGGTINICFNSAVIAKHESNYKGSVMEYRLTMVTAILKMIVVASLTVYLSGKSKGEAKKLAEELVTLIYGTLQTYATSIYTRAGKNIPNKEEVLGAINGVLAHIKSAIPSVDAVKGNIQTGKEFTAARATALYNNLSTKYDQLAALKNTTVQHIAAKLPSAEYTAKLIEPVRDYYTQLLTMIGTNINKLMTKIPTKLALTPEMQPPMGRPNYTNKTVDMDAMFKAANKKGGRLKFNTDPMQPPFTIGPIKSPEYYTLPEYPKIKAPVVEQTSLLQNIYGALQKIDRTRAAYAVGGALVFSLLGYLMQPTNYAKDIHKLATAAHASDCGEFNTMVKDIISAYSSTKCGQLINDEEEAIGDVVADIFKDGETPFELLLNNCSAIVSYDTPQEKHCGFAIVQVIGSNSVRVAAMCSKPGYEFSQVAMLQAIEQMCLKAKMTVLSLDVSASINDHKMFVSAGYKISYDTCYKSLNHSNVITDAFIASYMNNGPSMKHSSRKSSSKKSAKRSSNNSRSRKSRT